MQTIDPLVLTKAGVFAFLALLLGLIVIVRYLVRITILMKESHAWHLQKIKLETMKVLESFMQGLVFDLNLQNRQSRQWKTEVQYGSQVLLVALPLVAGEYQVTVVRVTVDVERLEFVFEERGLEADLSISIFELDRVNELVEEAVRRFLDNSK